ncbi:MAG: capsular biosynthesis protein [Sedimenticolaceae bacterium]
MPPPQRCFLFLQGPLSPLYARIAGELEQHGHTVLRINLCIGDALHWPRPGASGFRGRVAEWPAFIDRYLVERGVTDLILHGDRRIYHRIAAEKARTHGIQVIATELGYLRPDWMTIELDATSAGSHFPRDPEEIRCLAEQAPRPDFAPRFANSFARVAVPDVIYNLANSLLWFAYPHYQRHTIYFPPLEYAAWLLRLLSRRTRDRRANRGTEALIGTHTPFFIVPLQLEGDFQIRDRSPFKGIGEALELIMKSFAEHAPGDTHLVLKTHPLDNGLERWPRLVARLSAKYRLDARVTLFDGGRLDRLIAHAEGLVTINSSAGLEALLAGCPVKVLAPAIYDIEGMTDQAALDRYWSAPAKPDMTLVEAFVCALAITVQVRGTLYADDGLDMAVTQMARRILANAINTPFDPSSDSLPTREGQA